MFIQIKYCELFHAVMGSLFVINVSVMVKRYSKMVP